MGDPRTDRDAIFEFVQRTQNLTSVWLRAYDPIEVLREVWALLQSIPRELDSRERTVLSLVLRSVAIHLLRHPLSGSCRSSDIVQVWSDPKDRVRAALWFILQSYERALPQSKIASHIGVSASRLSHLIVQVSGYRTASHLHGCRVMHALLMLQETSLSVKEVAAAVSYTTAELDRHFHTWLGYTPLELRVRTIRPGHNGVVGHASECA
jgi:AraC-like DNA-binding protein